MRQFQLERVYSLDERTEDLPKNGIIGVDSNGDWFILELLGDNEQDLLSYRRDMANLLLAGAFEENRPVEFFRDYWRFICGQKDLHAVYFQSIIVNARKTQILGIMEELA